VDPGRRVSSATLEFAPSTGSLVQARPHLRVRLSIAAVLAAMAAVVLDAGMANVALPAFAASLDTTAARAIWIVIAYQAGLVMALLPCGALGERFGHRRVFTGGLVLFVLGAIGSATASSWPWLVACRVVEGLGGAAVMALGIALLRFTVPRDRLGSTIGWNALTVALASSAAPSIGIAIASMVECRWIFVTSLPLAGFALVAAPLLPDSPRGSARVDAVGIALSASVFAQIIIGAHFGAAQPALAAGFIGGAAVLAALLIRREGKKVSPLVPLDLLRNPAFGFAVLASVCCFAGQSAGQLTLPFHLQGTFGATAPVTGAYMTAWPLSAGLTALAAGWLSDRISTGVLCAIGAILLSSGLAALWAWPSTGDVRAVVPFIALCGVGFGLFQTPNNRTLFLAAPEGRAGAAGGMQGTARVSGQTAGALLTSIIFATVPLSSAPAVSLAAGAGATLLAAMISAMRARHRGG
jgi:DHA2 family multidrug resistance protein-like MFS transporter